MRRRPESSRRNRTGGLEGAQLRPFEFRPSSRLCGGGSSLCRGTKGCRVCFEATRPNSKVDALPLTQQELETCASPQTGRTEKPRSEGARDERDEGHTSRVCRAQGSNAKYFGEHITRRLHKTARFFWVVVTPTCLTQMESTKCNRGVGTRMTTKECSQGRGGGEDVAPAAGESLKILWQVYFSFLSSFAPREIKRTYR